MAVAVVSSKTTHRAGLQCFGAHDAAAISALADCAGFGPGFSAAEGIAARARSGREIAFPREPDAAVGATALAMDLFVARSGHLRSGICGDICSSAVVFFGVPAE